MRPAHRESFCPAWRSGFAGCQICPRPEYRGTVSSGNLSHARSPLHGVPCVGHSLLGRYRGGRILKLLCRISLEPDSCVRRTENLFIRHGIRSLLVAKFIPGLNTAAPSLAGVFRMPVRRFLIFDSLGAFFWVVTVISLGLIFSDQLEQLALRWGGWLVAALAGSLAAYVLWKFIQRRRFIRRLRIARITPKELMDNLTAQEK